MKITAIDTMLLRIPYRHSGPPTGFGGKVWTTLDTLLVRVDTDEGITGWGEAFGYNVNEGTKATIDTLIAPLCIGRDAAAIGALMADLQRKLHLFGRGGPVTYGLSGIDIALWDIAGKRAGEPLHRLLGGAARQKLRAYASLLRYGDPKVTARIAAEAVERGYRHVKLHEIEIAPVASARGATGADTAIMLDTNCPWSLGEATAMAKALAPHDLFWLEEPIWPPEDFAALARCAASRRCRSPPERMREVPSTLRRCLPPAPSRSPSPASPRSAGSASCARCWCSPRRQTSRWRRIRPISGPACWQRFTSLPLRPARCWWSGSMSISRRRFSAISSPRRTA